ncbi:hypothetical protein IW262DRAFT_1087344 [Armillaria fumosa]|nr:hypothetical protein IW262DRAFT_1087344 [Armillaria fumosa]
MYQLHFSVLIVSCPRPSYPNCSYFARTETKFLRTRLMRLLLDENVGYVPPFIVLFETGKEGKTRALFTRASCVPSPCIPDTLPKTCGNTICTESECIGLWHTKESGSIRHPSTMVRDVQRPDHRILCNLWGCGIKMQADPTTDHTTLQRCQKYKEVLYCSWEHQFLDWHNHKRVCEAHA